MARIKINDDIKFWQLCRENGSIISRNLVKQCRQEILRPMWSSETNKKRTKDTDLANEEPAGCVKRGRQSG